MNKEHLFVKIMIATLFIVGLLVGLAISYEAIKRYREKEKIRKAGHKGSIDLIRARNISEVL